MARYIDADALLENLKKQYGEELGWQCTVNMSDFGMMIEDAPTADVVPKSEVERLEKALADKARECNIEIDKIRLEHRAELANAKSEVVNKICCEIKQEITAALDSNYRIRGELELSDELYYAVNGKISALRGIEGFITEIENKYKNN